MLRSAKKHVIELQFPGAIVVKWLQRHAGLPSKGAAVNDPYQRLVQYLNLSNELIGQSSKGLIAEAARVLALMVAGYQARFGEMAMDESLRLLQLEQPKDAEARMLASGLETLAGVLGVLREETRDRGLH